MHLGAEKRPTSGARQPYVLNGVPLSWAEESTTKLMALVEKKGFKRAFRIYGAAIAPDAESLTARLLQDDMTKRACLQALLDGEAFPALEALLASD